VAHRDYSSLSSRVLEYREFDLGDPTARFYQEVEHFWWPSAGVDFTEAARAEPRQLAATFSIYAAEELAMLKKCGLCSAYTPERCAQPRQHGGPREVLEKSPKFVAIILLICVSALIVIIIATKD
jgi:hypothetical protein